MMMNNSQNQAKADMMSAAADQFPTLTGYLDEADLHRLISNHTSYELIMIEKALDTIETAMISIHRNTEIEFKAMILQAACDIWDNSRDLAFDEGKLERNEG